MIHSAPKIIQEAKDALQNLKPVLSENPLKYYAMAIEMLTLKNKELKTLFLKHPCNSRDEIEFFKRLKPQLLSEMIFLTECYKMEAYIPVGLDKKIKKTRNTKLQQIRRFYEENMALYEYYKLGQSYLDRQYFTRNQYQTPHVYDNINLISDPCYNTTHDFKWAQLMAYERLEIYVMAKATKRNTLTEHHKMLSLHWTGPKVGIIELIYALHTQKVFNHGACDLKDIVLVFEAAFNINIGQFHRSFYEITARKSEPTKFLNLLVENLTHRIRQQDEYKRLP